MRWVKKVLAGGLSGHDLSGVGQLRGRTGVGRRIAEIVDRSRFAGGLPVLSSSQGSAWRSALAGRDSGLLGHATQRAMQLKYWFAIIRGTRPDDALGRADGGSPCHQPGRLMSGRYRNGQLLQEPSQQGQPDSPGKHCREGRTAHAQTPYLVPSTGTPKPQFCIILAIMS